LPKQKSPGKKSFARITLIHNLIRQERYPNINLISETAEVSVRTIERDIESLRDYFGAPIEYDHFKRGYYYEKAFELPHVKLSEGEALALICSQQLFSQYKGTPFADSLKCAIDKLYELLPETISLDWDGISRQISFDVMPPRGEEDKLASLYEQLARSISTQSSIVIEYYAAYRGEKTTRKVDPYHLRYHHGAWYMIGFCHLRECVRVFAVDRIISCVETDGSFTLSEDFSLAKFLKHSFGIEVGQTPTDITVYFDSYMARFLREMNLHSSQQIKELGDGGIIFRMRISGLGEVKRWALSFGRHARVLEPEHLREEIQEELKAAYEATEVE
jgi:predicted DNA-binding transcriptional regulator YafY